MIAESHIFLEGLTVNAMMIVTGSLFYYIALLLTGVLQESESFAQKIPTIIHNTRRITIASPDEKKWRSSIFANDNNIANGSDDVNNDDEVSLWDGSNEEIFSNLSHPGYAYQPNESTLTGGWLAHRITKTNINDDDNDNDDDDDDDDKEEPCWVKDVSNKLTRFDYDQLGRKPRILVLYGSLRDTSFSRKLAFEFARLLEELGCDVRTYCPKGLPVRDPTLENEVKVKELRALSTWSDGQVWVSPEMHGTITGTFKNQIDWLPLNTGSVRPTQGRTCMVAQVNGGSQSFNAVNAMRILARWMRMPCCTNQSSVPKAWKEFDDKTGRMKDSSLRDRVIDVAEEFAKFTAVMAPVAEDLVDRYSERKEKEQEGRLLTQEEKELKITVNKSRNG